MPKAPSTTAVMQLLLDYDAERPTTADEIADRRVRYERRIFELIGRAAIVALTGTDAE